MVREGGGGGGSPGASSSSSSSPSSSGSPAASGSASDTSSPSGAGRGALEPAAAAAAELEDVNGGGGGGDDEHDGVDFGPYEPGPGFRGEAAAPGGRAAEAGDELWLVHLPQGLEAAALHGATLRLAEGAGDLVATAATKGGRELAVMAESPAYVRGLAGLVAGEGGGWAAKDLTRAVAVMQRPPEAPERTEGGGVEQIEIVDRAVLALEEAQKKRKGQKGGTSREHREAAKGEAGAEAGGGPPPKKKAKKAKKVKKKDRAEAAPSPLKAEPRTRKRKA